MCAVTMRSVMPCASLIVIATTLAGGPAYAAGAGSRAIRDQLTTEFILSRIELGDPRTAGQVVRPGTVLTLQAEGIPAKQMRVIQLNTKSPRFHVRDYAPVEVTGNGRVITGPGEFRLGRGARLSVLGLKVETDRIRFFTHTVEPVRFEGRQPVFGCTEFVFRFDAGVLERGDLGMVLAQIGKWLAPDPARAAAITLGPDRG